jgi:hypothetical protein
LTWGEEVTGTPTIPPVTTHTQTTRWVVVTAVKPVQSSGGAVAGSGYPEWIVKTNAKCSYNVLTLDKSHPGGSMVSSSSPTGSYRIDTAGGVIITRSSYVTGNYDRNQITCTLFRNGVQRAQITTAYSCSVTVGPPDSVQIGTDEILTHYV